MSEMAEQLPERKHVRHPPSVPFLWEEKPGMPKKDWKPEKPCFSVQPALPPPVKLVASVPFTWEEKPGKPLLCFSTETPETSELSPKLLSLPPPPMYSHELLSDISTDVDDPMEMEPFWFDTDVSFSSAPSLFANCLVPSDAISGAIPVDEFDYLKATMTSSPPSPASESDSSTSSYMTGASSLVGASFLEKLFPLLPPDSKLLQKAEESYVVPSTLPEAKSKALERKSSVVARKAPTLGELIMMSRRRSYMRKNVEMRKQNLSMEFVKNGADGCCFFMPATRLVGSLEWKKIQPRLKLV